jgi:hypothetical protein
MVLAFLQAERHSPRHYSLYLEPILVANALPTDLIERPILGDSTENQLRAAILGAYRGYRQDHSLFAGFPRDAIWRRVAVSIEEIGGFRYARCVPWTDLSEGTLLVRDGAANLSRIETSANREILELADEIRAGNLPEAEMSSPRRRLSPRIFWSRGTPSDGLRLGQAFRHGDRAARRLFKTSHQLGMGLSTQFPRQRTPFAQEAPPGVVARLLGGNRRGSRRRGVPRRPL